MKKMKVFKNEEFGEIRTVTIEDDPWFVGKDVCEAFGDTNYRRSLANIDGCDKGVSQINTAGGKQNMTIINESGLYSLLFQMQPQKAKGVSQNEHLIEERVHKLHRFKRWVTSEVLPSIRKHGGYISGQESMTDDELMARALMVAQNKIAERDKMIAEKDERIAEMKPKEIFADAVSSSDSSMLVWDVAKMIRQNGVPMGEKRFYKWLRENGYICKGTTSPTQRAMELGLFEVVVRTVERGNALPLETKTTKITGKGQQYFINKFLN